MTATDEVQRLPEDGEIVIATVKEVTGHGVYVTLKQKAVLKVIRVNKTRGEVDTSLKQVSGEERKSKLIEVKKSEKATAFIDFIKSKLRLTNEQVAEIEEKILQKHDYVYDAFEAVARKGPEAIQNIDLSLEIKQAIEEKSNKIQVPQVEVRGVMETSSQRPEGVELIKGTLGS